MVEEDVDEELEEDGSPDGSTELLGNGAIVGLGGSVDELEKVGGETVDVLIGVCDVELAGKSD